MKQPVADVSNNDSIPIIPESTVEAMKKFIEQSGVVARILAARAQQEQKK